MSDVLEGDLMPHRQSRKLGDDAPSTPATATHSLREDESATSAADDTYVLSFLNQVLVGESHWSLSEVRHLVGLRERARLGRS